MEGGRAVEERRGEERDVGGEEEEGGEGEEEGWLEPLEAGGHETEQRHDLERRVRKFCRIFMSWWSFGVYNFVA